MIPDYIASGRCQTREGHAVHIISCEGRDARYPIVGEIFDDGEWRNRTWTAQGKFRYSDDPSGLDLIPLPEPAREPREWDLSIDRVTGRIFTRSSILHSESDFEFIRVREILPEESAAGVEWEHADRGRLEAASDPVSSAPVAFKVGDRVKVNRLVGELRSGTEATIIAVNQFPGLVSYDLRFDDRAHYGFRAQDFEPASACTLAEPEVKLPEGVPPPPDGFEYWGFGPIASQGKSPQDVAYLSEGRWKTGGYGNSEGTHYALRIGSEIHCLNTVAGKGVEG